MKKIAFVCAALAAVMVLLTGARKKDNVMVKENGAYVVNTTELGKGVDGYVGPTPLKVYIRKNKVEKIEFLPNQETPKYFHKVKQDVLTKWNGKKVKNVLRDMKVETDGVTGATYSSNAVLENVKRGLQYYLKHKK